MLPHAIVHGYHHHEKNLPRVPGEATWSREGEICEQGQPSQVITAGPILDQTATSPHTQTRELNKHLLLRLCGCLLHRNA